MRDDVSKRRAKHGREDEGCSCAGSRDDHGVRGPRPVGHDPCSGGVAGVSGSKLYGLLGKGALPTVRVWVVHSYLVIYRPDGRPLQVVRVLSGDRDIAVLFE